MGEKFYCIKVFNRNIQGESSIAGFYKDLKVAKESLIKYKEYLSKECFILDHSEGYFTAFTVGYTGREKIIPDTLEDALSKCHRAENIVLIECEFKSDAGFNTNFVF